MSRPRRPHTLLVLVVLAALFVACGLADVDFANKACPCGAGWVCDTTRDVCVLPSELEARDGSVGEGGADAPADAVTGDAGPECIGKSCVCAVDADCKSRDATHCSAGKVCVECVALTDCGAGTYCNAVNQCVLGCKSESDCQISPAAPHCDLARHQCVACRTKTDCADPGDQCSPSGQCVAGCNVDAGQLCAAGRQCCQGLCIDTTKDLLNCGGCGVACSTQNGTPSCNASACSWACANGFGHCGTTNTGCESNLRNDSLHCGNCTTNCNTLVVNATGITCSAGACNYTACAANNDDCDAVRGNGCECACGTKKMERCCPGNTCTAPLTCLAGPQKCN